MIIISVGHSYLHFCLFY